MLFSKNENITNHTYWEKISTLTSSYLVCIDDIHYLKPLPTLPKVCIRGTAVGIDGIYDQYRWGISGSGGGGVG